ncbi:MAG: LysM peptidoglycan-binding domain-containing protein [Propionibacterium sp.]|nr:LysM peptidoglycan-binding domain-containing protein [Propionibacterium sp.]
MMRVIRALAALLILAGILLGVPVLLFTLGSVPPAQAWLNALRAPDDGTVLIGLLTVAGWLAWLLVTAAVLVEAVSLLSRRRLRVRLPGLGRVQGIAAVLLIAAVGGAMPATAGPAGPTAPSQVLASSSVPEEARTSQPDTGEQRHGPGVQHRVQQGDDLWSLAEHYYRDGTRWRQIAAANPELLTGGPDRLEAGWNLFIPTEASTPTGATTVIAGDTLSGLARQHLGDANRWPELWSLNRAVLNHPDELPVGLMLRLPDRAQPTVALGERPGTEQSPEHPAEVEKAESPPAADESTETPAPSSTPTPETTPPAPQQNPEPPSTGHETASHADGVELDGVDPVAASGGIGALLAAGLVGGFAVRRLIQLHDRPVGRRVAQPGSDAQRLAAALHATGAPDIRTDLALAGQLVAAHCRRLDVPPPELDHVLIGPDRVELVLVEAEEPPAGFDATGRRWILNRAEAPVLDEAVAHPWPALVCVGRTDPDTELLVDLERLGDLSVDLDDPADSRALVRAMLLDLLTRPDAPRVVVAGTEEPLVTAADSSHVTPAPDPDVLLDELTVRASAHHETARSPALIRLDIDRAEAWEPVILVLDTPLTTHQRRRLQALVSDPGTPIAVVRPAAPATRSMTGNAQRAHLDGLGTDFTPHLVTEPTRDRVVELFSVTGTTTTTPAPWWTPTAPVSDPTGPVPARVLAPGTREELPVTHRTQPPARSAPMVQLLGPIDLVDAAGTAPTRARKQCIEYCAWLLQNPGRSSREMATQLFVAETTRRSNMSRLRTWLGHDEDGQPYLPEAYSGRISLHDEVTSDWQLLQTLLPGDIGRAHDRTLRAALEMVRGAPLADAAPQQWGWAEAMRLDMVSMIRDIAWVLADRARTSGDLELVRWATEQGLTAAPDDELLLSLRLRAEHEAGNTSEAERLSRRIIVRARALGVDLLDETVDLLQEIAEGQVRARRAR